jgi:phosphate starvation-inducible protein PhoH and related proteins
MEKTLTPLHKRYFNSINSYRGVTVATGPAGTGKTHIACTLGIKKLLVGEIKKLIITRPAVNVDEHHGYLPGNATQKMIPYMMPIYDSFLDVVTKPQLKKYIDNADIEVSPFAYMRGRTFNNCIVIADETQNTTAGQMKMLMTRIGYGSKLVITGDLQQSDLHVEANGLADLVKRIEKRFETSDECCIDLIKFGNDEVLRSDLVTDILNLYSD